MSGTTRRASMGLLLMSVSGAVALAPTAVAQSSAVQLLCRDCGVGFDAEPLAVAPNGDAVAAFSRRSGGFWAALRRGQGPFEKPILLGRGLDHHTAIGANGTVAVTWRKSIYGPTEVRVRPRGGGWGARHLLGVREDGLAIDGDGRVHVVGNRNSTGAYSVTAYSLEPGGEWSAPQVISNAPPGSQTARPKLVAGPRGDLLAAWVESTPAPRLMTAYRPAGGEWQRPEPLAPAFFVLAEVGDLSIDAAGNAVAVFQPIGNPGGLVASYRPATGGWSPPEALEHQSQAFPAAAFDGAGNALVAWRGAGGKLGVVKVARRDAAGGAWSTPETVSDGARHPKSLDLAVAPDGTSRVAWNELRGTGRGHIALSAAGSSRTGRFGKPTPLRAPTRAAQNVNVRHPLAPGAQRSGAITALWMQAERRPGTFSVSTRRLARPAPTNGGGR